MNAFFQFIIYTSPYVNITRIFIRLF